MFRIRRVVPSRDTSVRSTFYGRPARFSATKSFFRRGPKSQQNSTNRPSEAIANFRQAIAKKPDFALAHNSLGAELLSRNDLDGAVASFRKALDYMQVESGKPITEASVDVVFVGSCTNGRRSDMPEAARVLDGRQFAAGVRTLVVRGSGRVNAGSGEARPGQPSCGAGCR